MIETPCEADVLYCVRCVRVVVKTQSTFCCVYAVVKTQSTSFDRGRLLHHVQKQFDDTKEKRKKIIKDAVNLAGHEFRQFDKEPVF